jgi:putative membrane protein insertion efficiency factor
MFEFFGYGLRFLVLRLIRFYQKTLSFDHSWLKIFRPMGYCRFYPSCSEYAYQAIEKYGFWQGGLKALYRLLRCHPFSKGGYDPLK